MRTINKSEYTILEPSSSVHAHSTKLSATAQLVLAIALVCCVSVIAIVCIAQRQRQPEKSSRDQSVSSSNDNDNNSRPLVEIDNGRLLGAVLRSRGGRNYFGFYNIPYAQPPVGNLRFESPQEFNETWTDVRNATVAGAKCIQVKIGSSTIQGEEDCLYLTVFSPRLSPSPGSGPDGNDDDDLPVLVYILGGAFIGGHASTYGGDYFMDRDVVLVLPEFRVGPMGNLNTGDGAVRGNMGAKDQVMALRWVQRNIHRFGGNRKKVTIFGNSSGAVTIHTHLLSPMSAGAGLFHGAISQSGPTIGAPIDSNPGVAAAVSIAANLGCPSSVLNDTETDTARLVQYLKAADATALLEAAKDVEVAGLSVEPANANGDASASDVFLSDLPVNLERAGAGQPNPNIPWIIGVNSAEMNILALALQLANFTEALNSDWEDVAPALISQTSHLTEIRDFYFGRGNNITPEGWRNLSNMASDSTYLHPTLVAARLHAGRSNSPVFLYWLSSRPIRSNGQSLEKYYDPPYGVTHADEVQYFFPFAKYPYIHANSTDFRTSKLLVDLWVTFAESGLPASDWSPVPKYTDTAEMEQPKWYQVDAVPKMVDVASDRLSFWNSFPVSEMYDM